MNTCIYCGSSEQPLEWVGQIAGKSEYVCVDESACAKRRKKQEPQS